MIKEMPNLEEFTGTEGYHYLNFLKNLKFTDGFKFLCEKVGGFWITDILASVQHLDKIKENGFIVWVLAVEDNKGVISAYSDTDENGEYPKENLLYTQEINYTDFPKGQFSFYQIEDVVLLKDEY